MGSPDSFTMIAAFGYNSSLQFSSFVSGTGQMALNAPNSQGDFSLTGTDLFGLTITPARKFRMLLHTNPTRERGECLETRAGASEDM